MAERVESYIPPFLEKTCFFFLVVILSISIGMVVLWSRGSDIRGIEYWSYILSSSLSFILGYLTGSNIRRVSVDS